ncbi:MULTISPECIES: FUSC family protein [unclassified Mesorhizobium]|uniref:FUSC family protein n=1 Tax=unclassified Mesorhizobium TaxID=325217 RepID=UPI003334CD49
MPRRLAFESLAYDRVNQLMPLLQNAGEKGDAVLAGGIAAVTVGLEILRLRNAQQSSAIRLKQHFPSPISCAVWRANCCSGGPASRRRRPSPSPGNMQQASRSEAKQPKCCRSPPRCASLPPRSRIFRIFSRRTGFKQRRSPARARVRSRAARRGGSI